MRVGSIVGSLLALALVACGEMGSDPKGPNAAFLILRDEQGRTREFYLGGYNSVADCVEMLRAEVEAATERGSEFWTNPEFNYGGVRQEGWIRHTVVGANCSLRAASKRLDEASTSRT